MLCIVYIFCASHAISIVPEQVHIAWTGVPTSMSVTWASDIQTSGSSVQYTPVDSYDEQVTAYEFSAAGNWTSFANNPTFKGITQRVLNVCTAYMTNLIQGRLYAYKVGSDANGWSQQFAFRAMRDFSLKETVKLLVYGDFSTGEDSADTIMRLQAEVNTDEYDAIFHNGDFAYDLDSDSGRIGDDFLNFIEPVASRLPYMTSQGNHEVGRNKLHYMSRFTMPGNTSGRWYSFNAGRVHFISYSTEQIFDDVRRDQEVMLEFLKNDLNSYDHEQYPWLVVLGHRPLYCSGHSLPKKPACYGEAFSMREAFEDLWNDYGVDLVVASHVHAYERLGPVYHNQSMTCEIEMENVCINSPTPIYTVTGLPGNSGTYDALSGVPLPFSKACDEDIGYSRLTVFNQSHLLWEQVRSISLEVSDYLWIIKDSQQMLNIS